MKQVAVAIPIYKQYNSLSELEQLSLKQCAKILGHYPVVFFTHKNIDTIPYVELFSTTSIELFDNYFFKNVNAYNQLMLSKAFYKRFKAYEYILIYQLDAWVFRDELTYWCNKGYDYIGAPFIKIKPDQYSPILEFCGGNGGLSLRKVSSAIKILNSFSFIYSFKDLFINNKHNAKTTLKKLYYFLLCNNTFYLLNKYDRNEDYFWSLKVPNNFSWFKIAPFKEAIHFSIETTEQLHFLNNKIPFGCHGWDKNEKLKAIINKSND